jgi:hypothetical protein
VIGANLLLAGSGHVVWRHGAFNRLARNQAFKEGTDVKVCGGGKMVSASAIIVG